MNQFYSPGGNTSFGAGLRYPNASCYNYYSIIFRPPGERQVAEDIVVKSNNFFSDHSDV